MSYETTLEVKLTLLYDYTPAERRTQDHPGYPAEAEVTGAQIEGIELDAYQFKRFWHDLEQEVKDQLIDEIIQHEAEMADEARREARQTEEGSLFSLGASMAMMYGKTVCEGRR